MNNIERIEWQKKTEKLNSERTLAIGDQVVDLYGSKGVVVRIDIPNNPCFENHGTVYVWQSEKTEYGSDNCEHYTFIDWKKLLRIK